MYQAAGTNTSSRTSSNRNTRSLYIPLSVIDTRRKNDHHILWVSEVRRGSSHFGWESSQRFYLSC